MATSSKEGAVLFACTLNAVRSPMAAAMLKHLTRGGIYIESAGVRAGDLDPLAVEVMGEIGLEIAKHKPRRFEDLEDGKSEDLPCEIVANCLPCLRRLR